MAKTHEGIYEVLEYDAQLELRDRRGINAVFSKRERVRFLQDNVIAYQDKVWGDGDIFADYQVSPGIAVDRYREGHCYWVLISLREMKNRGDEMELHIERTVKNGFMEDVGGFQIEIDHIVHQFSFRVIFPASRLPKSVMLIEKNTHLTKVLGSENRVTLPDGRQQVTWQTAKPRLFEAYFIRWEW